MASIYKQTCKYWGVNPQLTARLLATWIAVFVLLLITAPGVVAQTNVDFFCTLGGSTACTGNVVQSGSNFSTSGITVFNDSGPFIATIPFTWAFNTATGAISIEGTGMYSGVDLVGNILSFGVSGSGSTKDFSLVANWGMLPMIVQTQLGTSTGQGSGFVIYLTGTGTAAQSVDVIVTPAAPEPASMLLMGTGLLAIGSLLRRRRTASP